MRSLAMAVPRRRRVARSGKIEGLARLVTLLTLGVNGFKLQALAWAKARLSGKRRSPVQIVEIGQVVARPAENECLFDWAEIDDAELGDGIIEAFAADLSALEADDLRETYRRALEATSAR